MVALGTVAKVLRDQLLQRDDASIAQWTGVSIAHGLVVCGPELPWVDGARYVAPDPDAGALWMPTTRRPTVPAALLERAVLARCPSGSAPVLLLDGAMIPLGPARPLDFATLRALRW